MVVHGCIRYNLGDNAAAPRKLDERRACTRMCGTNSVVSGCQSENYDCIKILEIMLLKVSNTFFEATAICKLFC